MHFVKTTFPWATEFAANKLSYTINISIQSVPISIIGLNSSWIGGTNADHGQLVLGERQVREALQRTRDPAILIALMHHPLSYLADFDASDVRGLIDRSCDFVLHGHIHEFGAVSMRSPDSEVFYLAAGAGYQGRSEVLSYNVVSLDLDQGNAEVFVRRYSDRQGGFWAADTLMYPSAPDGILAFPLPERTSGKPRAAGLQEIEILVEELVSIPPTREPNQEPLATARPQSLVSVPDPPKRLVDEILRGRCILFAGSGASVDAQLPTWLQLVEDLIDEGEAGGQIDEDARVELSDLLKRGQLFPAAGYCRDKIGLHYFAKYLRTRLSHDQRSSQTHRLLSEIPFVAAVTTNYDKFIEYSRARSIVVMPDDMERSGKDAFEAALESGGFPVIKISGSLEDVSSIVLTRRDFQRLSFQKPNYIELIRNILTEYTVFFYGSGFVDPNVDFLLQEILTKSEGGARPHYAVMPENSKIMKDFWLSNYNIRVISYSMWENSHLAAKAFLEKLSSECAARSG